MSGARELVISHRTYGCDILDGNTVDVCDNTTRIDELASQYELITLTTDSFIAMARFLSMLYGFAFKTEPSQCVG